MRYRKSTSCFLLLPQLVKEDNEEKINVSLPLVLGLFTLLGAYIKLVGDAGND